MVIGITGNSGTGKSEIAKLLAKKINAEIINADLVAKKLSEPGNIYNEKIIELFGEEILENKKINRKKLAEIVYNNSQKRELLNNLTYIYVGNEIKHMVKLTKKQNVIIRGIKFLKKWSFPMKEPDYQKYRIKMCNVKH